MTMTVPPTRRSPIRPPALDQRVSRAGDNALIGQLRDRLALKAPASTRRSARCPAATAEDRPRQVAGRPAQGAAARRAHPRHRRRCEGADLRDPPAAHRGGHRDPAGLLGAGGAARARRPRAGAARGAGPRLVRAGLRPGGRGDRDGRKPRVRPRRWADLAGPGLVFPPDEVGLVPVGATEQPAHLPTAPTPPSPRPCRGAPRAAARSSVRRYRSAAATAPAGPSQLCRRARRSSPPGCGVRRGVRLGPAPAALPPSHSATPPRSTWARPPPAALPDRGSALSPGGI